MKFQGIAALLTLVFVPALFGQSAGDRTRELLRAGADPKIRTNNGQTAANLAESHGFAELKELFAKRDL